MMTYEDFKRNARDYAKYASVTAKVLNKVFDGKIKAFKIANATLSGLFEIQEFFYDRNFESQKGNLKKLGNDIESIIEFFFEKLDKQILSTGEYSSYYKLYLNKQSLIAAVYNKDNKVRDVFCNKNKEKEVNKEINNLFWSSFSNYVSMDYMAHNRYEEENRIIIRDETVTNCSFYSKEFYEAFNYINKFYCSDKNRAIIFYGNPGVGKSTIMKQVISKLDIRTIRLGLDALPKFSVGSLVSTVKLLSPDCIIIDDFDRIEHTASMLPIFEELHNLVKLTMISINNMKYFEKNKALVRPGRFDKFIKIERLDDYVIDQILKQYSPLYKDRVKDWPAAFIQELKDNIDVLGDGDAEVYIRDLQERIDYQNGKDD